VWTRFRDFARRPGEERVAILEALALLAAARAALAFVPFRHIARALWQEGRETPRAPPADAQRATVRLVVGAIEAAARHSPWQARCLGRAMAATVMLRRRGLEATMYLGLRSIRTRDAHAWVRSGDVYVCGGDGSGYTAVGVFGLLARQRMPDSLHQAYDGATGNAGPPDLPGGDDNPRDT
jgi:hypothetical protein